MTETYMSKDLIADIVRIKNAIKILDRVRDEHTAFNNLVEANCGNKEYPSYVDSTFMGLERNLTTDIVMLVRQLFFDVKGKDGFADIECYKPER